MFRLPLGSSPLDPPPWQGHLWRFTFQADPSLPRLLLGLLELPRRLGTRVCAAALGRPAGGWASPGAVPGVGVSDGPQRATRVPSADHGWRARGGLLPCAPAHGALGGLSQSRGSEMGKGQHFCSVLEICRGHSLTPST